MTTVDNKAIARRAFAALEAGNLRLLADLLAPDAVLHQCGFLEPIPARSILEGEFPRRGLLAGREVHLERITGEGDLVAMHRRTEGRYRDSDAPELDGKWVSFPSMTFIRLENGKIAEIWNIQDTATMQTQLRDAVEPASGR